MMNTKTHLTDELLISYLYNTLANAQREVLDRHLAACPTCRSQLTLHQNHQRQIGNEIQATLQATTPPPGMSFQGIAPRLAPRKTSQVWRIRFSTAIPLVSAALGLVLAIVGAWKSFPVNLATPTPHSTPFPALACFFLMFVSMDQFDRSFSMRPRFVISIILAFLLWLGSLVIGLLNLLVIRDLVIAAVIRAGGSPESASVLTILAVFVSAIILIGVIIGSAEFHYRHVGHPSSWKLFIWTMAIQLLILVLPYLLL
jgi:hypothetical protein